MNVHDYYKHLLRERGYREDSAQAYAVARLQECYESWVRFKRMRTHILKKLVYRPVVPRGVYLWGGVGRGKSFLMDVFYASVPLKRKTRVHFHEFMRSVHHEMQQVSGQTDPLDEVARRVAKRYLLICFDEFHVSDVADAMILYRLLNRLFALGTSFVMTSNYEPTTLYPEDLHRERILPAIALIQTRMEIIHVDAGIDYRRRTARAVPGTVYHTPLSEMAEAALHTEFMRFAVQPSAIPVVRIAQRTLQAKALATNVVWFDFATLCGGPRSQNDYLALASRFHVVIVSEVPRMAARSAAAARRFTWLVDVLYDHRVKLILSAECPPEKLYTQGALAHEFQRTVSRLGEMQSQAYLNAPWRETVAL